MPTPPWYPKHYAEVKADMSGLSWEARGFYNALMDECWRAGGGLPTDIDQLASLLGADRRVTGRLLAEIMGADLEHFSGTSSGLLAKVRQKSGRSSQEFFVNSGELRHSRIDRALAKDR